MLLGEPTTKDSSKLFSVAQELVEVACSRLESESLTLGKETVETLKKLASDSSSIEESVGYLMELHDAKMSALGQSLAEFKQEISTSIASLKQEIAAQTKDNKLAWAIANAHINPFKYFTNNNNNAVESTGFVKGTLLIFRRGDCRFVPNNSLIPFGSVGLSHGQQHFRDALCNQIHELTGQMPRLESKDDGYVIHYC